MKPLLSLVLALAIAPTALAFEDTIEIAITQGNETTALLHTVGENFLRIEVTGSNWPNPIDIVDLKSGAMTLLFPHNRSFMRLKPPGENEGPGTPGLPPPDPGSKVPNKLPPGAPNFPKLPGGLPPGVGPQSSPGAGIPVCRRCR